jgi:hypothetical protein
LPESRCGLGCVRGAPASRAAGLEASIFLGFPVVQRLKHGLWGHAEFVRVLRILIPASSGNFCDFHNISKFRVFSVLSDLSNSADIHDYNDFGVFGIFYSHASIRIQEANTGNKLFDSLIQFATRKHINIFFPFLTVAIVDPAAILGGVATTAATVTG